MKGRSVRPLTKTLDGEVTVPASKSYTARALLIGALASGKTILRNPLRAEDTDFMSQGLEALGVRIEKDSDTLLIHGTDGKLSTPSRTVSLGGAGTAVRFLTTAAGLVPGRVVIDGDERMRQRPLGDLIDALKPLGITARSLTGNGYPPVVIEGGQFEGGRTRLRGDKSSQFLSSILLCAPYATKGVEVEIIQDLVSRSYVYLTMTIMRDFGVRVTHQDLHVFQVEPGTYSGREYVVEGDMSSASYFLAAAAITGGRVHVRGINGLTRQGDRGLVDALEAMGCRVNRTDRSVELAGGVLRGIEIDMRDMPDSVPALAVVAAFASGTTRISNVGHLRYKESNRLEALSEELRKLGIETAFEADSLVVRGGTPRGAEIETYNDHRMAMAFAVAGLRVPGMVIRDPDCVNKSFPTFWTLLEELG